MQKEITLEINKNLVGQSPDVLVEGPSGRYPGQLTGRTRTNKIVNFPGDEAGERPDGPGFDRGGLGQFP